MGLLDFEVKLTAKTIIIAVVSLLVLIVLYFMLNKSDDEAILDENPTIDKEVNLDLAIENFNKKSVKYNKDKDDDDESEKYEKPSNMNQSTMNRNKQFKNAKSAVDAIRKTTEFLED